MIRKQVGDLSSHSTKYTSPALTQKMFANMRRVGGIIANIDADEDVVLEDAKDFAIKKSADVQESAYDQGRRAESQAKIYKINLEHAKKRKQKEDKAVKRYQALKRKPQTEAQARKNMMIYLRNVAGFKIDYFKGMTSNDIRLIFEKHFDSNVAFLQKTKEQMDEEDSIALKRLNERQEDKAAKKQKLDEEVEELKRHLQIVPNDDDDVYTGATPLARKVYVVDYEIYNENNKPYFKTKKADDIQAQIWKNQRSVHGQAKVKSWKSLESCGVQIITFITTQLILLVERRYPHISFGVDAAMDFKENMLSV
nr:hypothetical protein [Tanacetum cinerariifolium]